MNSKEIMIAIADFIERKVRESKDEDEYTTDFYEGMTHIAKQIEAFIEGLGRGTEGIDKHYIRVEGK